MTKEFVAVAYVHPELVVNLHDYKTIEVKVFQEKDGPEQLFCVVGIPTQVPEAEDVICYCGTFAAARECLELYCGHVKFAHRVIDWRSKTIHPNPRIVSLLCQGELLEITKDYAQKG